MEGTCFLQRLFHKRFKLLQIEYMWKSALLVLEANIIYIYMHIIRNIYLEASLAGCVYIYICDTGSTSNTCILFRIYIYIHMHSKHVYKPTFFIFYLYDILSAGGNYFFF